MTWPVVVIRVHILQKSSDESNSSRADDLSGADPVILQRKIFYIFIDI